MNLLYDKRPGKRYTKRYPKFILYLIHVIRDIIPACACVHVFHVHAHSFWMLWNALSFDDPCCKMQKVNVNVIPIMTFYEAQLCQEIAPSKTIPKTIQKRYTKWYLRFRFARHILSLEVIFGALWSHQSGWPKNQNPVHTYLYTWVHLSSVQGAPGWLFYIEDFTTQLYGDYFINHEIRTPIKQAVWKVRNRFFFVAHIPRGSYGYICFMYVYYHCMIWD